MKKIYGAAAAIVLLTAAAQACAVEETLTFDSLSRFDAHTYRSTVIGVLQNQSTPTTVAFVENSSPDQFSRCIPLFLVMLEKPGRYLLNLTVNQAVTVNGLISCGLQLKS